MSRLETGKSATPTPWLSRIVTLGTGSEIAGLLMLPLAVPLLIFGAVASSGGSSALLLEAAVSLLLLAGAPFVGGAAIRSSRT